MSTFALPFNFAPNGAFLLTAQVPTVLTVPVGGFSQWTTAIEQDFTEPRLQGLHQADTLTNGIVRSYSDIADSLKLIAVRESTTALGPGTTVRARVVYPIPSATTGLVSPVVRLFAGRQLPSSPDIAYVPVRNLNGDLSVELPINPAVDPRTLVPYPAQSQEPSTYCATVPDNHAHSWDCDGYTHFRFGVERGIVVPDKHLAVLEVKIV